MFYFIPQYQLIGLIKTLNANLNLDDPKLKKKDKTICNIIFNFE